MEKNLEVRRIVHKRLEDALRSGKFSDPLEEFAAKYMTYLFVDRSGEPVNVDFMLQEIGYGELLSTRSFDVLDTVVFKNETDVADVQLLKRSESYTEKFTFSFKEGVKVSVAVKGKVDIPFVGGGEVTVTGELSFEAQQSVAFEHARAFEVAEQINVPAHSVVEAKVSIEKAHINGPFTAYYVPVFTSAGRKVWAEYLDEVKEYKGISVEPLKDRSFVEIYPSLDLRLTCRGQIDGAEGVDVTVDVSQEKLQLLG